MNTINKKYGFWTTTAMVVGIVIGSGVFFKADDVLVASGGSLPVALSAWLISGAIMIVTSYVFSGVAGKIEKVNGIVDYFEEAYGETTGYNIAWFMTTIYYPALVSVLSWVSANYTATLFNNQEHIWPIALLYLLLFFLITIFSPVAAGRLQISTTVIKLIPLILVGVVGTITGIINGQTFDSFSRTGAQISGSGGGLALASLSTAFAYEGWIISTTLNAEINDSKKTLPKALVSGSIVIVIVYIAYYLGISGVLSNNEVIQYGDNTSLVVVTTLFGKASGTLLSVFVIISCLGTLNGLVMASSRGFYSIAARNLGPKPELFRKISSKTDSTFYSAIGGFVLSLFWLVIWYGNFHNWFPGFIDISELPIAFLYITYIGLYIWIIRNMKDFNPWKRYITPGLALAGSLYIIYAAVQKEQIILFTGIVLAVMLTGHILNLQNKNKQE